RHTRFSRDWSSDVCSSDLYLSMTDDLMRRFNSGIAERIMNNPSMPEDVALESKMVSRAIESAQAQVEGVNAEQRKNVLKYDDVKIGRASGREKVCKGA